MIKSSSVKNNLFFEISGYVCGGVDCLGEHLVDELLLSPALCH